MDFDEHEDQEEEEEQMVRPRIGEAAATSTNSTRRPIRYRECLKNHAVNIGGHALDGCGEFMAAGEDGSLDALKCAACNCHRNFHRKETEQPQFSTYYRVPGPAGYLHLTPRPLALPAAGSGGGYSREDEDVSNPSSSGGGGGGTGGSKKRHRTKFTQEQKDKMLEFAEKLGWRIQKHDESAVDAFCVETGVKRHVLKTTKNGNLQTFVYGLQEITL
ncbi:Zinc-finger homeodomain protein 1 [Euphorbia peplus]|nr:Zinc-finger homeodomain protein 1 [Euphorbia peplus]